MLPRFPYMMPNVASTSRAGQTLRQTVVGLWPILWGCPGPTILSHHRTISQRSVY